MEYINREAAIKEISYMMHDCFPEAVEELDAVITTLEEIPAADVVEVRQGLTDPGAAEGGMSMGIYLPNMEMPRKGQMLVIFPDGTSYVCFNGMRERLTQTTAIPVPPHGRLIDADALEDEDPDVCNSFMRDGYVESCE